MWVETRGKWTVGEGGKRSTRKGDFRTEYKN